MFAHKAVLLLFFAIVAVAIAIPAALPQPVDGGAAIEQRQPLENLADGEQGEDLKASSSYGYGYYGPYYGYPHYHRYYGYPYHYGWYPYRSYWGYYRPYYGYYW